MNILHTITKETNETEIEFSWGILKSVHIVYELTQEVMTGNGSWMVAKVCQDTNPISVPLSHKGIGGLLATAANPAIVRLGLPGVRKRVTFRYILSH